jgi:predicted permease
VTMATIRQSLQRFLSFIRRSQLDQDLRAEMAAHLQMAVEENLRSGMSADEARRQALIQFGGTQQSKENHRDSRGLPVLDVLFQDLRYTFRTLRKDLGFTSIAILILALGIGANIVVFSVVNTILLRPLPFPASQQLVWMAPEESGTSAGLSSATYSADAYDEFRAQNRTFQDVAGYFAFSSSENLRITEHGDSLPATGITVTANFFQVLGVQPILGRLFMDEESVKGAHPVAILSYNYWKRHYAADSAMIGKVININDQSVPVVGVLPESFDFGSVFTPGANVDIFYPAVLDDMRDWGNILSLVGRLKPEATIQRAQADANIVLPQLYFNIKQPASLGNYQDRPMKLKVLKGHVSGALRRSLVVLWCAVGAILVIVCVNLANLMLARAVARNKEFALRSALGAGRSRLVRQLLTESVVLSVAGSAVGLVLAYAATSFIAQQGSVALPLLSSVRVDNAALAWTLLLSLSVGILFGLVPGLVLSRGNIQEALKDSGRGAGESRGHGRLRSILVVSEVALACVLLVASGLLLRSFLRVLDVDLGFQPDRAAAIKMDYDDGNNAERRGVIFQQALRTVAALPGVEAAGIVDYLPLEGNRSWGTPVIKGKVYRPGELPNAFVYVITPGYFRAMGMQLLGRDFTWDDGPKGEPVIILNEAAAKALLPGEDAVGRMVVMNGQDRRIVGVIKDVHEANIEGHPGWQAYFSATQAGPAGAELVVRSKLPSQVLGASVLSALRDLNPRQPAVEFRPIQTLVDRAVSPRRFFVLLVAIFAALGLLLAALGIYGVISYSVTRQTQEIGVRMALGALPSQVQFAVLARTLRLAFVGVAIGAFASFAASKLIASLLFKTEPNDPATFFGVLILLLVVAFFAGYLPALRATRVDPMIALRYE